MRPGRGKNPSSPAEFGWVLSEREVTNNLAQLGDVG
jgi:hypothetical protein